MRNETQHRLELMRAVQQAHYPVDYGEGGNSRCATCLHIAETATTYLITTKVYGIEPESLNVTIAHNHLIVEGRLLNDVSGRLGIGRYARLLELGQPINTDYTEVIYQADGTLQVCVWKQTLTEPA